MIPSDKGFLSQNFEIEEIPTYTYKMKSDSNRIQGHTDSLDAMKQAIFKILSTERYQHQMYSWNYGVEFLDLYHTCALSWSVELQRLLHGIKESRVLTTLNLIHQKKVRYV